MAVGTGSAAMFTVATAVFTQLFPSVTVTVYWPLIAVVALLTFGFWLDELKPPGPDQLYVTPPFDVSTKFWFTQAVGLFTDITGRGLTCNEAVVVLLHPFASVTERVYNPPFDVAAEEIVGFCAVEL